MRRVTVKQVRIAHHADPLAVFPVEVPIATVELARFCFGKLGFLHVIQVSCPNPSGFFAVMLKLVDDQTLLARFGEFDEDGTARSKVNTAELISHSAAALFRATREPGHVGAGVGLLQDMRQASIVCRVCL